VKATTLTFAGIVACQVGTALAARTDQVSLLSIGLFGNPAAAGRNGIRAGRHRRGRLRTPAAVAGRNPGPGVPELCVLATFPVIVWGADEVFRAIGRRRSAGRSAGRD